jgi:hypothetical protein
MDTLRYVENCKGSLFIIRCGEPVYADGTADFPGVEQVSDNIVFRARLPEVQRSAVPGQLKRKGFNVSRQIVSTEFYRREWHGVFHNN